MKSKAQSVLPEVKRENDAFDGSITPPDMYDNPNDSATNSLDENSQEQTDVSSDENDEFHSCENASNQIVLYNPERDDDTSQALTVPNRTENEPPIPRFAESNQSNRVLPSIGAFTVQCAVCFKWRLIPTKEKYEEIREHILETPFVCETAREWRPDISCDDPADINQDGSRLWAIDKPSISQPPPGWQRLLRIRGEGSTRFADVYYAAPSGKRLRSMVEIQKYLLEHPEFVRAGVNMSQFSFQIPKPLQDNYVRKRSHAKAMQQGQQLDAAPLQVQRPQDPADVNPISWVGPTQCTELSIMNRQEGLSAPCSDSPVQSPVAPRAKKQATKRPSKKLNSPPLSKQPNVEVKGPEQGGNAVDDL